MKQLDVQMTNKDKEARKAGSEAALGWPRAP